MKFSVKYLPTALFSLKESNSTNSGAKTLFLPSPYSIKMAILNQAITIGGELEDLEAKNSKFFCAIRDAEIAYSIKEGTYFTVNNSFIKILKPAREGGGFQRTVSFREFVHITDQIEIIFDVKDERDCNYLKKYLHRINYFGKRGCFFQFVEYSNAPNEPNVKVFNPKDLGFGILQEYDDFDKKNSFENVNNFSKKRSIRSKQILMVPLQSIESSKSFTVYKN